MTTQLSIQITDKLHRRLVAAAKKSGKHESEVVCKALEQYLAPLDAEESAHEMAQRLKLIGCVKSAPRDLSANPKYFEDFGNS